MPRHRILVVFASCLLCLVASAKDKKKLLPPDILRARAVLVVVDTSSGVDAAHPNANQTAKEDVDKALMKWGRFSLAQDASEADLIITVRKGSGKVAQTTIGGIPQNNRNVILEPTDSAVRIGARQGGSPTISDASDQSSSSSSPHPQVEVGQSQDTFVVYRCNIKDDRNWSPLDSPPVWRYTAKNALQDPDVPAVDVFHQLITETEKQQTGKP